MSIIHDALKKVQQNMQDKPNSSAAEQSAETIEVLPSAKKRLSVKNILLILLSIAVISLSIYFILLEINRQYPRLLPFNPSKISLPALKRTQASKPLPHVAAAAAPAPLSTPTTTSITDTPTAEKPAFVLTIQGVMASGNHHIALINNKVYEVGSIIDGRKIVEISLNAVTIEYEGKQQEIPIKK